jgi:hypothetical protein
MSRAVFRPGGEQEFDLFGIGLLLYYGATFYFTVPV